MTSQFFEQHSGEEDRDPSVPSFYDYAESIVIRFVRELALNEHWSVLNRFLTEQMPLVDETESEARERIVRRFIGNSYDLIFQAASKIYKKIPPDILSQPYVHTVLSRLADIEQLFDSLPALVSCLIHGDEQELQRMTRVPNEQITEQMFQDEKSATVFTAHMEAVMKSVLVSKLRLLLDRIKELTTPEGRAAIDEIYGEIYERQTIERLINYLSPGEAISIQVFGENEVMGDTTFLVSKITADEVVVYKTSDRSIRPIIQFQVRDDRLYYLLPDGRVQWGSRRNGPICTEINTSFLQGLESVFSTKHMIGYLIKAHLRSGEQPSDVQAIFDRLTELRQMSGMYAPRIRAVKIQSVSSSLRLNN